MLRFSISCAAIVLSHALVAADQQRRPIRAKDIVDLRWAAVRSPSLSPDGRIAAFVQIEWDTSGKKAKRKRSLWFVPTDGEVKPYQVAPKHVLVRDAQWSPDGKRVAFVSDADGKETATIVVIGRDAKLRWEHTPKNGVVDFAWSPDGKTIAYTSKTPKKKQAKNAPRIIDADRRNHQLWTVSMNSQTPRSVTNGKRHIINFVWSPHGDAFAVTRAPSSDLDDMIAHSQVIIVDRKRGTAQRILIKHSARDFAPTWSPDGKWVTGFAMRPKRLTGELTLVPARGGPGKTLLKGYRGTPLWTMVWGPDSRWLWVQSFDATRNRLIRVDVHNGRMEREAKSVHNFWSFSLSKNGRAFILNSETGKAPPELCFFRDGKKVRQLTNLNPHVQKWRMGDVKEIRWKNSRDGMEISGVLLTPPDFKPGQPRPMIVELHGGPQGMWWDGWLGTYLSRGQYFTSRGYVVFLPNPRGSIGQGVHFLEANYQDWGGMDVQDILDGVNVLVKRKIADPKRMVVGGTSYGGYLSAMITTKTTRFRAALVDAAITDLVLWNFTADLSVPGRRYMGGDEFQKRDVFRRCSPFTYVQRVKTPTLVMHGAKDKRVPISQGRLWYRALKYLNVPTQMVVYPNGGHLLSERADQLDAMRRVLAWYEKHLK